MAKRGRRFTFHGAFSSQADARQKADAVGGFVRANNADGADRRYVVMTANDNPRRDARDHPRENEGGAWGLVPLALIGAGLWLIFGVARAPASRPALASSTVWISDPSQGGSGQLSTGATPPGSMPPWREASEYEIQAAAAPF